MPPIHIDIPPAAGVAAIIYALGAGIAAVIYAIAWLVRSAEPLVRAVLEHLRRGE